MPDPSANPGQPIDLQTAGSGHETSQKHVLIKNPELEIVQFIVPADSGVPAYEAPGELVLHCLEGRVTVSAADTVHDLKSGQILYLSRDEPFSIQGVENASLLATIIPVKRGGIAEVIGND